MRKILATATLLGAVSVAVATPVAANGWPKAPTAAVGSNSAVDTLAGGPNRPTCLGKFAPC